MTREEAIELLCAYGVPQDEKRFHEALDMAIKALQEPEIVRCGECKYYGATSDPELESYCYIDGRAEMTPDGYCSWGEKQVTGKVCSDTISRHAVIKAFCDDCAGLKPGQCEHWDTCRSQKVLRSLPPSEREKEGDTRE